MHKYMYLFQYLAHGERSGSINDLSTVSFLYISMHVNVYIIFSNIYSMSCQTYRDVLSLEMS